MREKHRPANVNGFKTESLFRTLKDFNYPIVLACFSQRTSPISSLRSVDLPAPLGPTSATLVSRSMPNSKSL